MKSYVQLSEGQAGGVLSYSGADKTLCEEAQVVAETLIKPFVDLSLIRAAESHGPDTRQRGPPQHLWKGLLQRKHSNDAIND